MFYSSKFNEVFICSKVTEEDLEKFKKYLEQNKIENYKIR